MKKVIFILIALILLIPSMVMADDIPPIPSLPLMIEGTAPEGNVTIELNGNVYEVYSDGKFYIPLSGGEGDIITFTMGNIVVTETYINPMESPFMFVSLMAAPAKVIIYEDDDDSDDKIATFTEEDLAWIYAHGGYVY